MLTLRCRSDRDGADVDLRHASASYPRGFQFSPEASYVMSATKNKTMTARAARSPAGAGNALGFGFLTEVRASPAAAWCLPVSGGQLFN
jgi:hypothetical protein